MAALDVAQRVSCIVPQEPIAPGENASPPGVIPANPRLRHIAGLLGCPRSRTMAPFV